MNKSCINIIKYKYYIFSNAYSFVLQDFWYCFDCLNSNIINQKLYLIQDNRDYEYENDIIMLFYINIKISGTNIKNMNLISKHYNWKKNNKTYKIKINSRLGYIYNLILNKDFKDYDVVLKLDMCKCNKCKQLHKKWKLKEIRLMSVPIDIKYNINYKCECNDHYCTKCNLGDKYYCSYCSKITYRHEISIKCYKKYCKNKCVINFQLVD